MTVGRKLVNIVILWLIFWAVLLAQPMIKAIRFKATKTTKGGHKP